MISQHDQPLRQKHVLVPRGKQHAKSFSELVESFGGIPVEIPLIAFRPAPFAQGQKQIDASLDTYDWIIFTSNVTVETFCSFYKGKFHAPKIAAIGEKTQEALEDLGMSVDFIPEEYVAEGFVREFAPHVSKGMRILIPKGNLARALISSSLREAGAVVDEVVIYETYMPEESKELLAEKLACGELDVLPFTSPSTIDHFMQTVKEKQLEEKIQHCVIACIGPVSKKRAESYGLTVHAYPEKYTVKSMLDSVISYINR